MKEIKSERRKSRSGKKRKERKMGRGKLREYGD